MAISKYKTTSKLKRLAHFINCLLTALAQDYYITIFIATFDKF